MIYFLVKLRRLSVLGRVAGAEAIANLSFGYICPEVADVAPLKGQSCLLGEDVPNPNHDAGMQCVLC